MDMRKTLLFAIISIIIIAIIAGFAYFYRQNSQDKNLPLPAAGNDMATGSLEGDGTDNHPYVGEDFTFIPPAGWIQANLPGVLVAYQNMQETQPQGSAADKINFKSYFAMSFDNANGRQIDQIAELVKQQTKSVAPTVSFVSETDGQVDNQPAKFIEADVLMQDVNFKVLLLIILKGDKYYVLSGNTTAEKWPDYRDVFLNVAKSLEFK